MRAAVCYEIGKPRPRPVKWCTSGARGHRHCATGTSGSKGEVCGWVGIADVSEAVQFLPFSSRGKSEAVAANQRVADLAAQ